MESLHQWKARVCIESNEHLKGEELHEAMMYDLYCMFQDFSDNQLKDYREDQVKEQTIKKEKQDVIKLVEFWLSSGARDYSSCVAKSCDKSKSELYYSVLVTKDELQAILKTLKS